MAFCIQILKYLHRKSDEEKTATTPVPSLVVFKASLDGALRNLV